MASRSTAPSATSKRLLGELEIDEVLVTIPEAASEHLEQLVAACSAGWVGCRFVVREIAPPPFLTHVPAE